MISFAATDWENHLSRIRVWCLLKQTYYKFYDIKSWQRIIHSFCEKWSFTIYNADSVVSVFPFEQFQSTRYVRSRFQAIFCGKIPWNLAEKQALDMVGTSNLIRYWNGHWQFDKHMYVYIPNSVEQLPVDISGNPRNWYHVMPQFQTNQNWHVSNFLNHQQSMTSMKFTI